MSKRTCCATPIATQKQLDNMYVGEEFDLPIRIATILNTLGVGVLQCCPASNDSCCIPKHTAILSCRQILYSEIIQATAEFKQR